MSNNSVTSIHGRHQLTMEERRLGGEHASRIAERDGRGRFASEDAAQAAGAASRASASVGRASHDGVDGLHRPPDGESRSPGGRASRASLPGDRARFASDGEDAWVGGPSTGR